MTAPFIAKALTGHKSSITSICFCPNDSPLLFRNRHSKHGDDKHRIEIASSSKEGSILLWSFLPSIQQNGTRRNSIKHSEFPSPELRTYRYTGHTGTVNQIRFSRNGKVLASASGDNTVRIWVPSAVGQCSVLKGHSAAVRGVDFGPICLTNTSSQMVSDKKWDAGVLLTCSDDKTMKLWSVCNQRFVSSYTSHTNSVRAARLSPDGRYAASASSDKTVKLWDIERGNSGNMSCFTTYDHHKDTVVAVEFHPTATCLASASDDGIICLHDMRSDSISQMFSDDARKSVASISIHPSGNYILACSKNKELPLKIWDLRGGKLLCTWSGADTKVNDAGSPSTGACVFSPDQRYFATGGSDAVVKIWSGSFLLSDVSLIKENEMLNINHCKNSSLAEMSKPTSAKSGSMDRELEDIISKLSDEDEKDSNVICKAESSEIASNFPLKENTKTDEGEVCVENMAELMRYMSRQIDHLNKTVISLAQRIAAQESKLEKLTDSDIT